MKLVHMKLVRPLEANKVQADLQEAQLLAVTVVNKLSILDVFWIAGYVSHRKISGPHITALGLDMGTHGVENATPIRVFFFFFSF